MKPRITINLNDDELEIWLNESGRDLLIEELRNLSPRSDHVHLATWRPTEVELSDRPYRSSDKMIHSAKIMLRPYEWDARHFPHVFFKDGE